MKFITPKLKETFTITSAPEWPSINFETDGAGKHTWQWTITWGRFKKSGTEVTAGNKWDAKSVITNYGGVLEVRATNDKGTAAISVEIKGANPDRAAVNNYLATKANSAGFDKILEQEAKFKHFKASGEPIRSFDNGYGMCQLTTPVPTFEQVWNWKLNIDGGLKLFERKRNEAISYLQQQQRTYTAEQLTYESVSRWNGGPYHEWDGKNAKWVRRSDILCDSHTGNIGWSLNDQENQGKTEAELHKRDKAEYSKPRHKDAHWKYCGACYADSILD